MSPLTLPPVGSPNVSVAPHESQVERRPKPDTRHYDFLDSLRALAAIYVVINHTYLSVIWTKPSRIADYLSVFQHGHFAVCLFIILSGFCLMLPTLPNGFRLPHGISAFLIRRAWRIIPPYYFALLFSLILIAALIHDKTGNHWDLALPVTAHSIVSHLLLLQDAFALDMLNINHVFWSISVEWRIYFFFPLLLLSWRLCGPVWTTALTIPAAYLVQESTLHFFQLYLTAHFLGLFALGMLSAAISFSTDKKFARYKALPWGWITAATALLSALVYYVSKSGRFPSFDFLHDEAFPDTTFGLFGASLLVLISVHPQGRLHRMLQFKPLVFVGTFAYSIYLIHAPVLQVIWQYLLVPLHLTPVATWLALVLVGVPISLAVAYVFYLFCERPFFLKRRNNKRLIQVAPPSN